MHQIPLIISSCDKCSDLWFPFFKLLKEYWPKFERKVYLCTDAKQFSVTGFDISCPLNMPKGSTWSENLMSLLEQMDEEYVLMMLEDFWLKSKVDVLQLQRCEQIMTQDAGIGFICMVHQLDPSKENPVSKDYPELIEYGCNTPYRVTTQAGLWRRDYLLRLLRRHESAWWFEMFGSKRSRRYAYRSYVVNRSIFEYDDGGVLFRGSYVSEYVERFVKDHKIMLNPQRRIASKATLMTEVSENNITQKLNPRFVFNYIRSHF